MCWSDISKVLSANCISSNKELVYTLLVLHAIVKFPGFKSKRKQPILVFMKHKQNYFVKT